MRPADCWTWARSRVGVTAGAPACLGPREVGGASVWSVADDRVFPSGWGVNPMLTVMAIAEHIGKGVVEELGK